MFDKKVLDEIKGLNIKAREINNGAFESRLAGDSRSFMNTLRSFDINKTEDVALPKAS